LSSRPASTNLTRILLDAGKTPSDEKMRSAAYDVAAATTETPRRARKKNAKNLYLNTESDLHFPVDNENRVILLFDTFVIVKFVSKYCIKQNIYFLLRRRESSAANQGGRLLDW